MDREDIARLVRDEDIRFIRLQFADIYGNIKNLAVTSYQLDRALSGQCMFDGTQIEGFADDGDAELFLVPDLDTFAVFPWRPQQGKVARLVCDVCRGDGIPYEGDPRQVLRRAVSHCEALNLTFNVGPECEFFLFDTDDRGLATNKTVEQAGYFDVSPLDFGENARRDIIQTLEEMGFEIEASHHEAAPGQHEIDFKYAPAVMSADNIQTFKLAVRTIAKGHGLHATFMPKPSAGVNGSGMHINMSLSPAGSTSNIFTGDDERGLSKEAYWFIGGLLAHVRAMAAITNPLVNSYKRLVPGYEAPVYLTWSAVTRNPMVRVPSSRGEHTRIELRSPDPAANPYLTLALCLEAGLDGIKNHIEPPAPIDSYASRMTPWKREELGIQAMPQTLGAALDLMEADEFVRGVLGSHVCDRYVAAKREEWGRYISQVSEWELDEYLYRF